MKLIGTAGTPNHNFLAKGKMKTAKIVLASSVFLGMAFGTAANAMAASPVGQWNITFYLEPGLGTGATQGICYLANGTWFSIHFPTGREIGSRKVIDSGGMEGLALFLRQRSLASLLVTRHSEENSRIS
jgi:hypothetical protein